MGRHRDASVAVAVADFRLWPNRLDARVRRFVASFISFIAPNHYWLLQVRCRVLVQLRCQLAQVSIDREAQVRVRWAIQGARTAKHGATGDYVSLRDRISVRTLLQKILSALIRAQLAALLGVDSRRRL